MYNTDVPEAQNMLNRILVAALVSALLGLLLACDYGNAGDNAVLILNITDCRNPSSGTDGRIVFEKGVNNIWICERDGRNPMEIPTGGLYYVHSPDWSPDCEHITFSGVEIGVGRSIYIANTDGTGLKKICSDAWSPAWSPDGENIAFVGTEGIYTIPAVGGEPELIIPGGIEPAWSPMGDYLCYVKEENGDNLVMVKNLINGDEKLILDISSWPEPAWSPDGELIAYCDYGPEMLDIWSIPAKGGTPWRITNEQPGDWDCLYGATEPSWTPEGDAIVFSSLRNGSFKLWGIEVKR
jgi:Tol biopolymer transport system component